MNPYIKACLPLLSIALGGCLSDESPVESSGPVVPNVVDSQAPVLSAGGPTGTLSAGIVTADLVVSSDEQADCKFGTQAGISFANMTVSFANTGGTNHAATVAGLIGGRTYTYYVRCMDTSGNANTTDYQIQFNTTATASDTTAPTLSAGAPTGTLAAGVAQTTLSLNSNEAAFCRYGTQSGVAFSAMTNSFATTGSTSHATAINGLVPNRSYSYFVRCQDASGNANSSDFAIQFNTPPAATDTTPPVRSNGNPSGSLGAGTQSTSLGLSTDEPATCRFGTTAGQTFAQLANTFGGAGTETHSATVNGLADGQQYTYYARCEDGAGNANGDDFVIQFDVSTPATDVTPPTLSAGAPSGTLPAGTTQTTLSLSSNEAATCRYGTQAGVAFAAQPNTFASTGGTSHTTTVAGLADGQSYTYYVRCEDSVGNATGSDFPIQFAVDQAATDTTPPALSAGSPSGTLSAGTTQTSMTLSSNEAATCRYGTQAGIAYGAQPNVFASTGGTSHSTTIAGLNDGQSYSYYVRCQDSAGNATATDFVIQFDVDQAAADTTPPVRSNGAPTGVLTAGTQSVDISLDTDENATCRYGLTAGVVYAQIPNQFNGTGALAHATTINGLADGQQYDFYVRCEDFAGNANSDDFLISFSVAQPSTGQTVTDDFAGNGPLLNYTTNNASALPNVARANGRYRAELTDNSNDITLHFNNAQGRLDAKLVSFPFEYIARNIGIGTVADSQIAPTPVPNQFNFAGIQVHVTDLNSRNSAHLVVGHRGSTTFTIEGKNTVNGNSQVNDDGANILPSGRADIRIVGQADRSIRWYWQQPNPNPGVQADNWNPYRGSGILPGAQAAFGSQVYIGLITYAFANKGIPFVGTADSVELVGE